MLTSLQGAALVQGVLAAALAGAVLGLLYRGLGAATLSAGDSGSHFVGYVLALAGAASASKGVVVVAVLVPLAALGLPAGQASVALWRRLRTTEPVSRHGGFLICALCAVLAGAAILAELGSDALVGGSLFAAAAVGFAALRLLGLGEAPSSRRAARAGPGQGDQEVTDALRACGRSVRDAADLDEAWTHLREACGLLGIAGIELQLYVSEKGAPGVEHIMRYVADGGESQQATVCQAIPLMDRRFLYGELAFTYAELSGPDEQRRAFLYVLAEHLAELLGRIFGDRAEEVFTVHRHTMRRP